MGGVPGKCIASLSAAKPAPFVEDLMILDSRTNFDMCPTHTHTPGYRPTRDDLGFVVSATGYAFPAHTIITCIDALQEDAECVPLRGLA